MDRVVIYLRNVMKKMSMDLVSGYGWWEGLGRARVNENTVDFLRVFISTQ